MVLYISDTYVFILMTQVILYNYSAMPSRDSILNNNMVNKTMCHGAKPSQRVGISSGIFCLSSTSCLFFLLGDTLAF